MLRAELFSSRKISVLPISKLSTTFSSSVGFFEGNSESAYGALCNSIDCQAFEGFAHHFHDFLPKKKPLANGKIQEPSALKRKILAGTCQRRTGEGDKK